ncbi:MAG: phosphate propanoyltransferase [Lachnospiraceae bacterium]|nr:phosphate propanoyltransferase [Candidatus Equihabitans merdae]
MAVESSIVATVTNRIMELFEQLEENPYQVPAGVSARHLHLQRDHVDALFGPGYQLTPMKPLSQVGQYACQETVEVIGPKGKPIKMRVLGPERKRTQVEVSLSDSRNLGVIPPVRTSGDIAGSPGLTIRGPKGEITISEGLIIPDRHVHMTPADAAWFGVRDGERVSFQADGEKGGILRNVVVRVTDQSWLDFHIDTDDANAFQIKQGQMLTLIKERNTK